MLTTYFFKRLLIDDKDNVRAVIELARDYWLKITLNSVHEELFILDIVD